MDNEQNAKDLLQMARADWEAGMSSSSPYSICFHAQQAAEKYLKAFLAFHQQQVPKSHDVQDLITRCAKIDPSLSELVPFAYSFRLFGVEIRYSPSKEIAVDECPKVWTAMSSIMDAIRKRLPDLDKDSTS